MAREVEGQRPAVGLKTCGAMVEDPDRQKANAIAGFRRQFANLDDTRMGDPVAFM